jgi:hypothetical protein
MVIKQRDVYILPHPISKSGDPHPFIVLSVQESNEHESTFIAVMVTSEPGRFNDHSFALTNDMFISDLKYPKCHARMHLMMLCLNSEIIGSKKNEMKAFPFQQLMKSIGAIIFNYEFKPLPL